MEKTLLANRRIIAEGRGQCQIEDNFMASDTRPPSTNNESLTNQRIAPTSHCYDHSHAAQIWLATSSEA